MCMGVLSHVHMSEYQTCVWCPLRWEESVGSSGSGLQIVKVAMWVLRYELSGPQEDQSVSLIVERSLQPDVSIF